MSRTPALQDFLSGTPREAEVRVAAFQQNTPGDGTPASQETVAYLSYDEKNLYVVFVCRDDPARIRARLARRDDIEGDDNVGINLDTFHDHQRFYMFLVNPLGVQLDAVVTEGQGTDTSFDTLWYSDGRVTHDGFIVWMSVPFKSLRFSEAFAQNWGIALGRSIARNSELSFWPYVTERQESTTRQFAEIEGLNGISAGRNVQLLPYFSGSGARFLGSSSPAGFGFRSDSVARGGLDAKLVVRDAVTVDFTVNPDFSQVESDEPQVTVNQRFEVFFPERRPFFLENAGYFQTPVNLFFSRRIAEPQFGGRITGKLGGWAVGVLAIDDRSNGSGWAYGSGSGEPRAGIAVGRVQREFGNQSTVGVLLTSRDGGPSSNRVLALDTRIRLNANWTFAAQAAVSDARETDRLRASGAASRVELAHTGRHTSYAARYVDYSPGFQSRLGFIPRVDIRTIEHSFRYFWKPDHGLVLLFGPDLTASLNWNRRGELQDGIIDVAVGADLHGPTGMGCRHVNAYELFLSSGFRRWYTNCGVDSSRLQWLELHADYGRGRPINYFPAPGLSPFVARGNSLKVGATARPGRRISLAETYLRTWLAARSPVAGFTPGARIFDDHVLRSKLNVQLTRELSLRAIVDYHSVVPDLRLVASEYACVTCRGYMSTRRVTADVLVTYLPHPGTAAYVGYMERRENPIDTLRQGPAEHYPLMTGRQVFVKLTYLLRY